MANDELDVRVLKELRKGGRTPENLASRLQRDCDALEPAVRSLEERGWLSRATAGYVGQEWMEILLLTTAGRKELEWRETLSGEAGVPEPVEVTRAQLLQELVRRGFPRERLEIEPTLRHDRFYFYPSVPAYAAKND
jgi:DNA-binding MarR family transcriptional regulator